MTSQEEKQLNRREIEQSRELLQSFKKHGYYTVPKITWWVFHYEELSRYSYENRNAGSCVDGLSCSCSWNSPESLFSDLHSALKEIVELHQYEGYFQKELEAFETVREDHLALLQWLKKNEKLGADDFLIFWTEWLDEDDTIVRPWIMNEKDLGIKFRAEEWRSTIKFLEVFNELYWDSEICP